MLSPVNNSRQKHALLIRNGFITSTKFDELYVYIDRAAKRHGVSLEVLANQNAMVEAASGVPLDGRLREKLDFILFWDKDTRYAHQLEAYGHQLYNSATAIELCDDKSLTHIALAGKLPMPKTVIAPLTYPRVGYTKLDFLEEIIALLGFPMIVKECFGSFGLQVYLAKNRDELLQLLRETAGKPILFQEFIEESRARDVRVYVVNGECAAAMERSNTSGDFRANVAQGGTGAPYALSDEEKRISIDAARLLGLDFCGVDILHSKRGPLICEVNSNAHFVGLYKATGVDVAEKIMEMCCERARSQGSLV